MMASPCEQHASWAKHDLVNRSIDAPDDYNKTLPDAVVWVIFTVDVASKPFPRHPTHGWSSGQTII